MALKATIFKADLSIADMDRNYYADHALTLARHPSETDERMMVRLAAFALNAHERLAFGGGISTEDEPALWRRDLTGAIEQWIDVGLPEARDLRRACGRAGEVIVYAYGGRAVPPWWSRVKDELQARDNLFGCEWPKDQTLELTAFALRTMKLQCSIQEGGALFSDGQRSVELMASALKGRSVN